VSRDKFEIKCEKPQLFTPLTSYRIEQFCRKYRRAADIEYVPLWTRGLIAHIVSFLSDSTENKKRGKKEIV